MEITKNEITEKKVQYTVVDEDWTYMDTLTYTPEEFETADVDGDISKKYTDWKTYVTTPIKEKTKEEKETEIAQLEKQKADLESKISSMTAEISAVEAKEK